MILTKKVYTDAKKLLNNGNCLAEVVDLSNLSYSTCRIIKKSKGWKSYLALVKFNHITVAQRKLMNQGLTKKEARIYTANPSSVSYSNTPNPTPSAHEPQHNTIVSGIKFWITVVAVLVIIYGAYVLYSRFM